MLVCLSLQAQNSITFFSENHTIFFRLIKQIVYPFTPNRPENHTSKGGTCLYGYLRGVPSFSPPIWVLYPFSRTSLHVCLFSVQQSQSNVRRESSSATTPDALLIGGDVINKTTVVIIQMNGDASTVNNIRFFFCC